jgi:aminomethyltransferase
VVAAGAVPCGLACRDTLRLEAGMCLYGNDIDDGVTPLQANLGWIVKLDGRPPFIGHAALVAEKDAGPARLLRGLEMVERGIARHGYDVVDAEGRVVGVVTSGTQAPFVKKAIAFALLDRAHATPGTSVSVSVRGRPLQATVVKLPFYKRAK